MKRVLLFVCLLLLCATAFSANLQKKTKRPTKPTKVAKPLVLVLDERVKETIAMAEQEAKDNYAFFSSQIVGQPVGWSWIVNPDQTLTTEPNQWMKSYPNSCLQAIEQAKQKEAAVVSGWQAKKLDTNSTLASQYEAVCEVVKNAYGSAGYRNPIPIVGPWEEHEKQVRWWNERKAYFDYIAKHGDPQSSRHEEYLRNNSANNIRVSAEAIPKLRPGHDAFVKARNRFGAELWKYYDFASAHKVKQGDGHDAGMTVIHETLFSDFFSRPRPLTAGNPTSRYSATMNDPALIEEIALRHTVTVNDPDLQPFKDHPEQVAIGLGIEPDVERLRGYKEAGDETRIADTCVVPDLVASHRVKPEAFEGSDSYRLFLYGAKIPVKSSEFRSISSDDPKLRYNVLAYDEDFTSGKLKGADQQSWARGNMVFGRALSGTQMQNYVAMPKMLLRVQLTPGVLPGRKRFKVNGAEAGWTLDQGTSEGSMRIVKEVHTEADAPRTADMPTEPAGDIFLYDYVRVEVLSKSPLTAKNLPVILGRNGIVSSPTGTDVFVPTSQVKPNEYHTDWIQLVPTFDPRLDPDCDPKYKEPGVLYLALETGDRFQAALADPRTFREDVKPVSASVHEVPRESLWRQALRKAAKADGKYPDVVDWSRLPNQEAETISNAILTQVLFKTHLQDIYAPSYFQLLEGLYGVSASKGDVVVKSKITLGDHAAMILLRDHFTFMMEELLTKLNGLKSVDQKVKFMKVLVADESNPASQIEVNDPVHLDQEGNSIDKVKIRVFQHPPFLALLPKTASQDSVVTMAMLDAFDKYVKAIQASKKHAESIADNQIDALLALTGCGFKPVVEDLVPQLYMPVRRSDLPVDEMVKDRLARSRVETLDQKYEEVQAQKKYSSLDTQVVLTMASLVPVALPGGAIKAVASLIVDSLFIGNVAGEQLPQFLDAERDYDFAVATYDVLGSGRLTIADAQRTPAWTVALNFLLGGYSAATAGREALGLMSAMPKQQIVRESAKVLEQIKPGNAVAVVRKLTAEEQAAFFGRCCATEIEAGAQDASHVIAEEEEKIKTAVKELREEVKKLPEPVAPIAEPPAGAAAFEPVEPKPAVRHNPWEPGQYRAPNNYLLKLKTLISKDSAFFDVWLMESTKRVAKILKPERDAKAARIFADIRKAQSTLEGASIPFLRQEIDPKGFYIVQEAVEKNLDKGKEFFIVSDYVKQVQILPDGSKQYARLAGEYQDAVLELVDRMRKANIAFEDFKFDNIYIRRVGGKLEAGVLDVDRIAKWGDFTETMNTLSFVYEATDKAGTIPGLMKGSIWNMGADVERYTRSCDEYWELIFQRQGMLEFGDDAKWANGRLDLERVEKVLPAFGKRTFLDLSDRLPELPQVPKGLMLFIVLTRAA